MSAAGVEKAPKPPIARRGVCLHFNGVFGPGMSVKKCCRAGVAYRELTGGEGPGWATRLPCSTRLRGVAEPVTCTLREEPSAEQIATWDAWADAHTAMVIQGVAAVQAAAKEVRSGSGTVPCPQCGGALHWSKSSYNGHVHGACETKECISWMQ